MITGHKLNRHTSNDNKLSKKADVIFNKPENIFEVDDKTYINNRYMNTTGSCLKFRKIRFVASQKPEAIEAKKLKKLYKNVPPNKLTIVALGGDGTILKCHDYLKKLPYLWNE